MYARPLPSPVEFISAGAKMSSVSYSVGDMPCLQIAKLQLIDVPQELRTRLWFLLLESPGFLRQLKVRHASNFWAS